MFKLLSCGPQTMMILPPSGHLQYLGAFSFVTARRVGIHSVISWVETWVGCC